MSAARQSTARVPSLERVQKHHVKIRCWESFASRRERNSVLAHCLLSHTPSESTYKEREATPRRAERHGRAEVWLKAWLVPNAAARPSHTKHTTATTFKKETDGHKTHITHTHTHTRREGGRERAHAAGAVVTADGVSRSDGYGLLQTVTHGYGLLWPMESLPRRVQLDLWRHLADNLARRDVGQRALAHLTL